MKVFAGIDPSITNTGLVILDEKSNLVKAVNGNTAYKKKKFCSYIERYLCQVNYIVQILSDYEIIAIGYEDYSYNSVHKAYSLGEYNGILKGKLYEALGVSCFLIPPTTNKLFAVGNGFASKELVSKQAKSECTAFGNPTTDITDAYFLAKFVFYRHDPEQAVITDKGNSNLRTRLECVRKKDRRGK